MQISVKVYADDALRMLDDVHRRHIPFALALALTQTAKDVQAKEKAVMRQVFDRPTPYVMNALQVKPATKAAPVAIVGFREFAGKGTPAKQFLTPNIHGGGRSQKSHERRLATLMRSTFMVPGKAMMRDAYGNVPASVYTRILSQLGVATNADANATASKRSRAKRRNDAYFVTKRGLLMHRKGSQLTVALVPVRAPVYQKRFPFYETAQQVVAERFPVNFVAALERAISTSNYRGKWT